MQTGIEALLSLLAQTGTSSKQLVPLLPDSN